VTPYATASGSSAREEITKILRRFGCESVGFMDDFEKHEVPYMLGSDGRTLMESAELQNLLPPPQENVVALRK
jgi:hypothetical protein